MAQPRSRLKHLYVDRVVHIRALRRIVYDIFPRLSFWSIQNAPLAFGFARVIHDDDRFRLSFGRLSDFLSLLLALFRSVAMMAPPSADFGFARSRDAVSLPRPTSLAGPTLKNSNVIDKESFFSTAVKPEKTIDEDVHSNWAPTSLRPVPAFYPLERSSRFVEDELSEVVTRVSEANRVLSVHAVYCNETATASLLTAENVEMHLSLWKTSGGPKQQTEGIAVELQRRKGDSIAFHRYSKHILDAAMGDFDQKEHIEKHGDDLDLIYSKKLHRLLNIESGEEAATELENAIIAIEIAHGLLMKDRMDARQLGLESLCLLTDPNKTGITTALIASRVVLLGTAQDLGPEPEDTLMFDEAPFQEIRQTILSLIQLRRIGDIDAFDETEVHSEEEEHITTLHNLALAVLANALDVIENEERLEEVPEETRKPRARTTSSAEICDSFLEDAAEVAGNREILKTLITELGKAGVKPHNAHLSAKCVGSLCRASEKARRRAKELGAKTVVQTALDVGQRTHLKLEKEAQKVMTTLTTMTETETTGNQPEESNL
jgi:hypothetical protein